MIFNSIKVMNEIRKNNLKNFFSLFVIVSLSSGWILVGAAWAEETTLPSWIKTTSIWWGEEKITDEEFINSLQYLLENEILVIPQPEVKLDSVCGIGAVYDEQTGDCVIPDESENTGVFPDAVLSHQNVVTSWIKVTALWWGQNKISDQDFVDALEYLAENRILEIPGPELESAFQKLPEPINPLAGYPTFTTSWTNIERMEDFQVQGHRNSENYLLRFKLVSVDQKEIASDGTISISIMDEYNRILYLDAFSVKKNDFSKYQVPFSNDEDLIYSWDIPTSDVKLGFGELGTAKMVFTDRAGNSFSKDYSGVPIPKFS